MVDAANPKRTCISPRPKITGPSAYDARVEAIAGADFQPERLHKLVDDNHITPAQNRRFEFDRSCGIEMSDWVFDAALWALLALLSLWLAACCIFVVRLMGVRGLKVRWLAIILLAAIRLSSFALALWPVAIQVLLAALLLLAIGWWVARFATWRLAPVRWYAVPVVLSVALIGGAALFGGTILLSPLIFEVGGGAILELLEDLGFKEAA